MVALGRKFILLPPIYYDKVYNFSDDNSFYIRFKDRQVDKKKAWEQWSNVIRAYMDTGVNIHIVEAKENLPELTFVGDSIFLFGKKAIISRFRHKERQQEAEYMKQWAQFKGFEIMEIPEGLVFEGNAEAFYSHEKELIIMGYGGNRTSLEVADILRNFLNVEVIPVEKGDFHLDVVMFMLRDYIIYADGKISEDSIKLLKDVGFKVVKIDENLIEGLELNSTYVENTVFVNDSRNALHMKELYLSLGFDVKILDTSEFHLVGGGVKCLTLEHYRFEEFNGA